MTATTITRLAAPARLRRARRAAGRLLPSSRAGVVLLLALAVANGVFLYLLPGRAATDYAWDIRPATSAAFLGAGYLAGTVATALVVFCTRSWRSLRVLPLPLVVLSLGLLAATLLHADRFHWSYPPTWVWTGVYAGVPFVVAVLWRRQERLEPPRPAADPALRRLRFLSAALGGLLAAGSLALFAAPHALAGVWPWELTALMARAVASWYALVATALLCCAVSLRRPSEAIIPYATLASWSALLLALPLRGDMPAGAPLAGWLAVMLALLALSVYALATAVPLVRARGERM